MNRPCIAFKMNFCDGGASSEHVGFNGICSAENLFRNVREIRRPWCSNDRCACKKFLDGRNFCRDDFICYESTLLKDWRVEVGESTAGKHLTICGGQENHLCVLTTRKPGTSEAARFVFAIFLVKKIFKGDADKTGCVEADKYFRPEFRPHEAAQINFWDVYQNPNATILFSTTQKILVAKKISPKNF